MNAVPGIAGVTAARSLVPSDRSELTAMVRELYASGMAFAFVGGGTELDLGNAPRALDAVVRTTALDRVVEYSPEDQTVTVEAGMRLAALDALLAQHDQILPIDVGDRRNATVGGAIATNAFGPQRHRYGSIKDLIVGIEIVRPDGVVARSGGKVVKNVAGFDIPKLMVGSLGTLGGILTATFRVFPKPAVSRSVLVRTAPAESFYAACIADRALEPVAIAHHVNEGGIVLTFAGLEAAVDDALARLSALATLHRVDWKSCDRAALAALNAAEAAVRMNGAWRWTTRANAAAASTVLPVRALATTQIGYPTLGVTRASAEESDALDAFVAARGASTVFHAMPARARASIDAWGPPPPAFALMRAIKTNFDPKGLCNPGRFVGGL